MTFEQIDRRASASRLLLNRGAADPGVFDDITNSSGLNRDRFLFQSWEDADMLFGPSVQDFTAGFVDLDGDGAATSISLFWTISRGGVQIYTTLCHCTPPSYAA